MRNNYLAFFAFGIVLISMTAATGNYLYATLSDIFFLAAFVSYRRQRRLTNK